MAIVPLASTGPVDLCKDIGVQKLSAKLRKRYEIHEWHHALAVLVRDHEAEWNDIEKVLHEFTLTKADLLKPGGRKTVQVDRLESAFEELGWDEKSFTTEVTINKVTRTAVSHKVDCLKGRVALEIEWNAKDMSFDRDLINFATLFGMKEICLGVIITRSTTLLNAAYVHARGKPPSWGTVTHMAKLVKKITQGGSGGCPVVVFGITTETYEQPDDAREAHKKFLEKQQDLRKQRLAALRRKRKSA